MSLRQDTGQQNEQQMFGVACVGDGFWCSSACLELDQKETVMPESAMLPKSDSLDVTISFVNMRQLTLLTSILVTNMSEIQNNNFNFFQYAIRTNR